MTGLEFSIAAEVRHIMHPFEIGHILETTFEDYFVFSICDIFKKITSSNTVFRLSLQVLKDSERF